jgi:hypothetical protein
MVNNHYSLTTLGKRLFNMKITSYNGTNLNCLIRRIVLNYHKSLQILRCLSLNPYKINLSKELGHNLVYENSKQ